ncbi:MAG: serine protease [Actinobacteria bacterium]|nr:serine protease [Actinomycetota bacterium]
MTLRRTVATVAAALAAAASLAAVPPAADPWAWTLDGRDCSLIAPVPAEVMETMPVETGPCPGVRPGARVVIGGGGCTMNFLFEGWRIVKDKRVFAGRYIGTAGHCVFDEGADNVEQTWSASSGPVARDAAGNRIGSVVYAILKDPKDFALIRLDSGVEASAQMCHWGGPVSLSRDIVKQPVTLRQSGQGDIYGSTIPGRTHWAGSMASSDHVFATGPAIYGDSGSPVITQDGKAVGVLVGGGVFTSVRTDAVDAGIISITRLGPQADRAQSKLGLVDLFLQTAPLANVDDGV